MLTVKSRSGEDVKLHIAADMRVVGITKISLGDIKVGSFIGTTTVPGPDGMPTALEVHVFPESMRGTGEGSRPFDLKPNSTMTNATVSESVVGNDGHTILVKYKDGEKKVLATPETPVVTYVPADKSDLKPGEGFYPRRQTPHPSRTASAPPSTTTGESPLRSGL